jgi:hypothetical protein
MMLVQVRNVICFVCVSFFVCLPVCFFIYLFIHLFIYDSLILFMILLSGFDVDETLFMCKFKGKSTNTIMFCHEFIIPTMDWLHLSVVSGAFMDTYLVMIWLTVTVHIV